MALVSSVSCSKDVISLKDKIHDQWFLAQSGPNKFTQLDQDLNKKSLIKKNTFDPILELANIALERARECQADPQMLGRLESYIARINLKLAASEVVKQFGDQFYRMEPDTATDLMIVDVNKLANAVHVIGRSLLPATGTYCGCKMPPEEDSKLINSGVLNYCEGVASQKGYMRESGTQVEHRMGAHSAVITLEEAPGGFDTKLTYTESGDSNWRVRRDKLIELLKKEYGFTCESEELSTKCEGMLENGNGIRALALLISRTKDIDLIDKDCIANAIEKAISEAKQINEDFGQDAYKRWEGIRDSYGWKDLLGCKLASGEERREEREEEEPESRREKLNRRVGEYLEYLADWQNKLLNEDVDYYSFTGTHWILYDEKQLEEICQSLANSGYSEAGSCKENLELTKAKDRGTIKSLIHSCGGDFEKILADAIKAGYLSTEDDVGYYAGQMAEACHHIGDSECEKKANHLLHHADEVLDKYKQPSPETPKHEWEDNVLHGLIDEVVGYADRLAVLRVELPGKGCSWAGVWDAYRMIGLEESMRLTCGEMDAKGYPPNAEGCRSATRNAKAQDKETVEDFLKTCNDPETLVQDAVNQGWNTKPSFKKALQRLGSVARYGNADIDFHRKIDDMLADSETFLKKFLAEEAVK